MDDERTCQELHEHIEELTTRIQVLETAVDHWRFLYKQAEVYWKEKLSRG